MLDEPMSLLDAGITARQRGEAILVFALGECAMLQEQLGHRQMCLKEVKEA